MLQTAIYDVAAAALGTFVVIAILTAKPIFFTNFDSAILAKGLSAPQHSTYFVIFDEGRLRDTYPVAKNKKKELEKS